MEEGKFCLYYRLGANGLKPEDIRKLKLKKDNKRLEHQLSKIAEHPEQQSIIYKGVQFDLIKKDGIVSVIDTFPQDKIAKTMDWRLKSKRERYAKKEKSKSFVIIIAHP